MDSPRTIADKALEKLPGDPHRDTAFTNALRASIDVAIEASLLTDEGRPASFSLLLEIDDEGQAKDNPRWGIDESWTRDIPCEPKRLTARDLAASSRLSKAGETFFHVERTETTAEGQAAVWISAVTRPPKPFRREILADRRHLGLTVFGPFHLLIEANGGEVVYVRSGSIQHHDSRTWPKGVRDILYQRSMDRSSPLYQSEDVIHHAFHRIGRAMWLSATGGTVAILSANEPEATHGNAGDWRLAGAPLDIPALLSNEYARGLVQGRPEGDGDQAKASEHAALAKDAEIDAEHGVAELARFTELDGAVILRSNLTLAGFGRKLEPDYDEPLVYIKTDERTGARIEEPSLGGTRHKSAAHWVAERAGRLALVASQDRKLGWLFAVSGEAATVEYWPWRPRLF